MFKNFFFTILLSFVFVSFLEASNEKINQQLFEIKTSQEYAQKINDEKTMLIMGQIIQKENEIKELRKELKEYVNKEDLQREINYQNNRIEDINSHVDKLSISVTVVGILITIILLLFTGTFFYVSNKKHLEKVDEWINKNKDKILEPIHEEGRELLKSIEDRALKFYQEQLKDLKLDEKLNESQKEVKAEIVKKINEILIHKESEQYTYYDWFTKYLNVYDSEKDYKKSLFFIEKALESASSYEDIAQAMFHKARLLGLLDNCKESVEMYDELIDKFKSTSDEYILAILKLSLINKFEMNLILGINNEDEDVNTFLSLIKNDEEYLSQYNMLKVLRNGVFKSQDSEIENWKNSYGFGTFFDWSYEELKAWANTFEDEEVKERLLRYIDIFEKHNETVEEN